MLNFRQEMEKSFSISSFFLNIFALIPGVKNRFKKFRICICFFLLIFVNECVINAIFYERHNIRSMMYVLNILAGTIPSLAKATFYMMQYKQIEKFLYTIREIFWNEVDGSEEEKIIIESYGRLSFKFNIFQALILISTWPISVRGQLQWLYTWLFASDSENPVGRFLLFRNWYTSYIDIYADPYYQILFIGQMFGMLAIFIMYSAFDTIFTYLLFSICAQFKLVQVRIKNFDRNRNKEQSKQYLYKCVSYHQKLGEICEEVESCFAGPLLFQVGGNCLYFCLAGYVLLAFGQDKSVIIYKLLALSASLLELFSFCFGADYLTSHSAAVAEAAYDSNWADADKNVQKIIAIIIMRAQKPIYITLKGFAPATLVTFKTVISTAFSIFTMLKTTIYD